MVTTVPCASCVHLTMQLKTLVSIICLTFSAFACGATVERRGGQSTTQSCILQKHTDVPWLITDTLSTTPAAASPSPSSFPSAATTAEPNPFTINVTADTSVTLVVISESSLYQLVVYQGFPNVVPLVFLGTGFGTFLMTPQGQTTVTIPPAPQAYTVAAIFQFAQNSSAPFQLGFINAPPTVQISGNQTLITIRSDDSATDNSDEVIAIVDLIQN